MMTKQRKKEKATILIVEDSRTLRRMLGQTLSKQGYETLGTESGQEALQIAAQKQPDLVLLDLILPDVEGIELLPQLRAINRNTRIIILTAYGNREAARYAMESGAFDFLTKPFDIPTLHETIKEALASSPAPGFEEISDGD